MISHSPTNGLFITHRHPLSVESGLFSRFQYDTLITRLQLLKVPNERFNYGFDVLESKDQRAKVAVSSTDQRNTLYLYNNMRCLKCHNELGFIIRVHLSASFSSY